ncbi:hypothetical protein BD289DRAFT_442530 [Coniella lustricola]|uniref:Uncharacterized protein n=1 Tax=Coniella lustricola TaxID=2025994 RepID=A0A2T2ZY13_9PEZI|nr:hypothetical protein BD289DRAFT_442530 [Coniella lustricola]
MDLRGQHFSWIVMFPTIFGHLQLLCGLYPFGQHSSYWDTAELFQCPACSRFSFIYFSVYFFLGLISYFPFHLPVSHFNVCNSMSSVP